MSDTIFALSSGSLPSGVAIIRLSGPKAHSICTDIVGSVPAGGSHTVCNFIDPSSGGLLDQGIVLAFKAPASFTGEDVIEFHCHGGQATVERFLNVLSQYDACRIAEAGEFSRRAFENGKMDLTALEGLSDLISAQTESQRKQALDQSLGHQRKLYDGWRTELIRCRAMIEAAFDFSDEGDVSDNVNAEIWSSVENLEIEIGSHLDDNRVGEIIKDGFRIALLGPPNSGKSSLLNALAKRDVAIVTDIAGTTRDVLTVNLNIDGYLVIISDTAGLRESDDIVEKEGMRRSLEAATEADLVFWLQPIDAAVEANAKDEWITVHTKSDLARSGSSAFELSISIKTDNGLDNLLLYISKQLGAFKVRDDLPVISRIRHRNLLVQTMGSLSAALNGDLVTELRCEELRMASDAVGRICGHIDVEDLLDVIFSEFCVGK